MTGLVNQRNDLHISDKTRVINKRDQDFPHAVEEHKPSRKGWRRRK